MKKESYMSKNEIIQYLKIGVLCSEVDVIAKETKVTEWSRKLKTCVTYLSNTMVDRLKCLDKNQLKAVKRRQEHTSIFLQSTDDARYEEVEKYIVQVDKDDLETLATLALESCKQCNKQSKEIEQCEYRIVMHRLGLDVARKESCEFKVEDKIMAINMMCMNSKCKFYWEDCCMKNMNEERLNISENGQCETFEEGTSYWYKDEKKFNPDIL